MPEEFPESLEKIIRFDGRKALIVPVNSKRQILIQDRRGYKKPDWGYFGGGIEIFGNLHNHLEQPQDYKVYVYVSDRPKRI
ncbi:MAG TPA: hypothetical protein VJ028_00210 [Patescibacteria group bacterium]|nr:hypothetical protein [Patescibacteria group bacterium]